MKHRGAGAERHDSHMALVQVSIVEMPAVVRPADASARLQELRARVAAAAGCDMDVVPTVARSSSSSSCVMCIQLQEPARDCGLCMCGSLRKALTAPSLMERSVPGKRRVRFASTPMVRVVERYAYTDIVGDIRDPGNPNYGAMGVTRDLRLSSFAFSLIEELASECFARWKQASEDSRQLRGGAAELLMGWSCGGADGMEVDSDEERDVDAFLEEADEEQAVHLA